MLSIISGCAARPDLVAWTDAVLEAERRLQRGQFRLALEDFRKLEDVALFRSDKAEMRMRQAEVYRRQGDFSNAKRLLWAIEREKAYVDHEQRAKVLYLLGRSMDDAGHVSSADKHLLSVVNRFPNTGYGWRAWVFLKPRLEAKWDEATFFEFCRKMFKRHRKTDIGDNFIYAVANRYFQKNTPDDDRRALSLYERFMSLWTLETSGFWDEVVWELSLVYHRMGRFRDEVSLLQRLLATREPGWPGETDLKSYKYAFMRIAKLHMFQLQQPKRAAELFGEYASEYPTSIFRDDMLWWEGHAWMRAGATVKANVAWNALKKRFPDSKYTRRLEHGAPAPTQETPIP